MRRGVAAALLMSGAVGLVASGAWAEAPPPGLEAHVGAAPSWEVAAARAAREDRLILAYVQHYPGMGVPDLLTGVVLADEDVCALIAERFVLVRVSWEDDTPLRGDFGLSPTTFGRALLVTDPAGVVLGDTERVHPVHVDGFLRGVLAEQTPDSAGTGADDAPVDPAETPPALTHGERLARRGELEAALALLEAVDTPRGWLARARIKRRLRRDDAARAALERAGRDAPAALGPALLLEAGRQALCRGEGAQGLAFLQRAAAGGLDRDASLAAAYTLGAIALVAGDRPAAERVWRTVVAAAAESPWAARARARLAAPLMTHARLDWPAEEVLETCAARAYVEARPELGDRGGVPQPGARPPAREPAQDSLPAARRTAQSALLRSQRADGSWPSPWEISMAPDNAFTTAYTAICTWALLGAPGPEARAAAGRGLASLSAALRAAPAAKSGGHMNYDVWVRAFAIRCLARSLQHQVGDAPALRALLREQVAALAEAQGPSGGWTYLRGETSRYALSFVTAAVLVALADARDVGVAVPAAVSDPALARLAAMQLDHGGFAYLGGVAGNQQRGLPGAAGRGPACALALWRWQALALEGVREQLATFSAHHQALWAERGKTLMHTGADGQGSHYLLFDLAHAAEALAALPAAEHPPLQTLVQRLLAQLQTTDGAFMDTPMLGPCVGSGFALEIARALSD